MITYRALLHRFQLVCDDPVADRHLRQVLAPLQEVAPAPGQITEYRLAREDAGGPVTRLLVDGAAASPGHRATGPIGQFLGQLDRDAEHVTGGRFPVLHAAACHRDGHTVIVPGAPNAGKSTLMAHLVHAGWTYLSDELVAIVPGTPPRLLPYPRSIVLDEGSWSLFANRTLSPSDQLATQLPDRRHLIPPAASLPREDARYPITDVALYSWRAGAAERVDELDAVDCLRALLGSSFSLGANPQRDLDALAQVVDAVACWQLQGEQLDGVQRLLAGLHVVR